MANIPGANNVLPGVFTDVQTTSRGTSIPGGTRIPALIGEGSTDQVLVSTASGGGNDGFNPTYTSTSGSDGRHFVLSGFPLVSNRTTLFKNGVPLVGLESTIDLLAFNNKYDYRIDITNGKIELQRAHLVDQGGSNYVPLSTNVGVGVINALTLEDANAPKENWTIRCVSVQRNGLGAPIIGTAKFLAFGSVSGAKLDANGNPIVWVANDQLVSNGILQFSIVETVTSFREGDGFSIKVDSGVLNRSDSLTANFIPTLNLNDPVLAEGLGDAVRRHGSPSVSNNLSLGCQLAFANTAPAVITVQAAPSMPRRTSIVLTEAMDATSTNDDDFIFPLPLGFVPDFESNIHFFVTNNATNVESQILPNKLDFYLLDTPGNPTTNQFIVDNTPAPGGNSYFYTVKEAPATLVSGEDGYIGRDTGFFTKGVFSSSVTFDASYVGKTLKLINATNSANESSYLVNSVSNGKLFVTSTGLSDFTTESSIAFQVIDVATNLPLVGGSATDGVLVDTNSATGTLTSAAITFSSLAGTITTRRLKISGSANNNDGLYDITSYNLGTDTLTLARTVVDESDMRYEVVDSSDVSNYIVVNKNVVPDGFGLRVSLINDKDAGFYDAGWVAALESLESVECDILVPLPRQTASIIFQNALSHCKSMSNIRNKKERVLFCGAINGLTPDNITGIKDAAVEDIGILEGIQGDSITEVLSGNIEDLANYSVADAFGNTYRCVYFYPDQIVVQAGAENVAIDGFYMACAAAGFAAADVRIENPFTNKVFSGFTIPRNRTYSTRVLESLAEAGACVLQPVTGGGRCVYGITTSQSGFVEEQEISIVFIRDRVAKILRSAFKGFIGQPESKNTQAILNTQAVIVLNALVSQGLITNYADLVVARDSVDPRQWNISVRVQPTYPVNFIYIKVGLGLI